MLDCFWLQHSEVWLFHTYFWYLRGDWQLTQVDGFDTFVDSISPPTTQQGADTFLGATSHVGLYHSQKILIFSIPSLLQSKVKG